MKYGGTLQKEAGFSKGVRFSEMKYRGTKMKNRGTKMKYGGTKMKNRGTAKCGSYCSERVGFAHASTKRYYTRFKSNEKRGHKNEIWGHT